MFQHLASGYEGNPASHILDKLQASPCVPSFTFSPVCCWVVWWEWVKKCGNTEEQMKNLLKDFPSPTNLLQPASPRWPSWIKSPWREVRNVELFRLAEVVAHVPRKTNSLLWDNLLTLFHPNMHLPCYRMTNMDITPHTFIWHAWICHPDLCLARLGEEANGLVPKQNLLSWDQNLVCVFNSLLMPVCKEWLQFSGTFAERLLFLRLCFWPYVGEHTE